MARQQPNYTVDTGTAYPLNIDASIAADLPRSLAPNPFFQIDQRVNAATSRANDTYASDRWYVLTQSNPITVTAQQASFAGVPSSVILSQANASAQRFGYATIIESKDCRHLRDQIVTFRPTVLISASQAVRIAVLEWTGGADVVTSDVVNSWTSSVYTAGNFFKTTTMNVVGVGVKTPSVSTITDMDPLTVTLGSNFNNLILFIWVEQVAAQNVTLELSKVRFVPGNYAGDIAIPNFADELARYRRYFRKTFPYATVPAQASGVAGGITTPVLVAGAVANSILGVWDAGVDIFPGSSTVTFYNPVAANAFAYNQTKANSATVTSAINVAAGRMAITATGLAGWVVGDVCVVHATEQTEL